MPAAFRAEEFAEFDEGTGGKIADRAGRSVHSLSRLFSRKTFKITKQDYLPVLFTELGQGPLDAVAVLGSSQGGHRTGRGRSRHGNFLSLLGREVIACVPQAMIDDPAQPTQKRAVVRVLEIAEGAVGGQVRVLQNVFRLDLLAEPVEPRPNEDQRAVRVLREQAFVRRIVPGLGLSTQYTGDRFGIHYTLLRGRHGTGEPKTVGDWPGTIASMVVR